MRSARTSCTDCKGQGFVTVTRPRGVSANALDVYEREIASSPNPLHPHLTDFTVQKLCSLCAGRGTMAAAA